jgi:hypothetical protein
MMSHAREFITMSETNEASHRNFLAEFEEKAWPIYQRYGYSRDTALLMWNLDSIRESVEAIEEHATG